MTKINENPPTIYLSGAIENLKNFSSDWRLEAEKKLRSMGFETVNPIDLVDDFSMITGFERKDIPTLKKKNPAKLAQGFKEIIKRDLEAVSYSDYILVYWDKAAAEGAGTHGEATYAFSLGIPVYLVAKIKPEHVPVWLLGCCEGVFANLVDALGFFKDIAQEKGLRLRIPDVD